MSWLSQGLGAIFGGGSHPTPTPMKFGNVPPAQSPLPGPGAGGSPSGGAGSSAFTSAQQSQLQSALNAAGIWGTIQNLGGDVWDVVSKTLPKGADGSVDWGKLGGDIVGWVSSHKKDIVDAVSAYSQYQRQNKADQLGKEAVDMAKQGYAEKAPLRVAGQAGMLNPQANAPDLSSLKAGIPKPTLAPLPVAGQNQNMRNAQGIAGPGSGNPFAKPLPVAPIAPTGPTPGGTPGAPSAPPSPTGPIMRPMTPQAPRPLPIAAGPSSPGGGLPPQNPDHFRPQLPPAQTGTGVVAQGGPISAGPQDRRPLIPQNFARPQLPYQAYDPLPVASY